jgi:hypothetical protein
MMINNDDDDDGDEAKKPRTPARKSQAQQAWRVMMADADADERCSKQPSGKKKR